MVGGTMILREATRQDLPALAGFWKREFDGLNIRHKITPAWLRKTKASNRMAIMLEDDQIVAGLWVVPIDTDEGPGFEMAAFAVAANHPDRIKALDALCLFSLNLAAHEGRNLILGPRAVRGAVTYGRDFLGMVQEVQGIDPNTSKPVLYRQWGNAQKMMGSIVKRRPKWSPL